MAAFLVVVFLVPFEAVHPKVSLPFSSDLDRFLVAVIIATWVVSALVGRSDRIVRLRSRGWAAGMTAFVFVAVASIAVNVGRITNLGEWDGAQKKMAFLIGLAALFAIFTLTLRVAELRPFSVLIVVLAAMTAVGTIYEQKTGYNVFYSAATTVFSPVATVEPAPTELHVDPSVPGRPLITGPTRHPLSVTSLLGMALPFAVVLAAMAPSTRRRLLWVSLACLMIAGALVTQRKSGAVVPAVALLALFVMRPRQLLRLAPFGVVAIVIGLAASGGSFTSVTSFGSAKNQDSTLGRTGDYPAIVPDLLSNPLLGRGYGTHDTLRTDTYRIFDNQYLGEVYEMGGIGLFAFIALIISPLLLVRSLLHSDNPLRGPPALAAAAGCLAFAVAAALYDVFSFSEAPYLFLFLAAMCTCAASVEVPITRWTRSRTGIALPANA
jgi:hypothetical protein